MIYSSWDIECDRLKLVIMGQFQNFKKMQKIAGDIILHMCKPYRYGSWDRVTQTGFFVLLGHFCPFTPLTNQKIKILKKLKKHLEMSSFYTCVPKIMIIWYMLPEIWSATDINFFCHSVIFYPSNPLLTTKIKILKKCK